MIPLLVFGGWALIVAFACIVGMAREDLRVALAKAKVLAASLAQAMDEVRLAHDKTAIILEYTEREIAEEYTEFDEVLKGLPVVNKDVGYPRQHYIMRARGFHAAAYHAVTEDISDKLTMTKLAFDAWPMHLAGRDCVAWARNGWLILPESVFDKAPKRALGKREEWR
jgi:hypothetical protein